MARPDPIEYAERLYGAIRAANFSPISFLAFGNAIKDGMSMRNMPRIAAEPFMRVVGEMLDLEHSFEQDVSDVTDAEVILDGAGARSAGPVMEADSPPAAEAVSVIAPDAPVVPSGGGPGSTDNRRATTPLASAKRRSRVDSAK